MDKIKKMYEHFVPQEIFLTKGIGRHKEKLASFEEALRDAQIANYNIVPVSSIFPPHCKTIPVAKGVKSLRSGQILHCVISRNTSNEHKRLISASVGLAIPKDPKTHGYISEHHSFGETEKMAGEYAEDLAALMLSTTLGIEFDNDTTWNQKEEIWKMSGKIVRTTNITQSAICVDGLWTTVVAAAVFVK
ncbi:arginine decarboxylase [Elusimicrobium simillimum]|uniref:pyruvoyl-dependent arginine decarboxylase n=1 Tax=Elusimicrobium simillimum TaxID=3143438 RepID=UPI003C702AF1